MIDKLIPLVLKGISIAQVVWENKDLAFKALDAVKTLVNRDEPPTLAEIAATEADLDALLEEFNAPLPPDT